jgi:hypothetical protein
MSIRALIVAIENYPKADGLASLLINTNRAGDAFYDWLIKDKKVDPANIRYCTEANIAPRTAGTTRDEILDQFREIVQIGRDTTEELYFFFSGHGFCFVEHEDKKPADVLVASDFVRPDISGVACLRLDSLQSKMYTAMGRGHHYYFIDACRNPLSERDVEVPEQLGQKWGASRQNRPCMFTLFSTTQRDKASTSTKFVDGLIAGLRGRGRAKSWVKGSKKMVVKFNLLADYLRDRFGNPVAAGEYPDPTCDGVIARLVPPPKSKCVVEVVNADAGDSFELKITKGIVEPDHEISAPFHIELDLLPDVYDFEVTNRADPAIPVSRIEPPASEWIDLFDDCAVKFQKGLQPPSTGEVNSSLTVRAPVGTEIRYVDLHRGDDTSEILSARRTSREMRFGSYSVELRERGMIIDRRQMNIAPGKNQMADFLKTGESPARQAVLNLVRNALDPLMVECPAIAARNLSLWLSLLGAAHLLPNDILLRGSDKHSIEPFGLLPVRDHGSGFSFLYVLLGADDSSAQSVVLDRFGSRGRRVKFDPVETLPGVWQAGLAVPPGPGIFSFKFEECLSASVVTHFLPNRATFITATRERGEIEVHQYLLPAYPRFGYLSEQSQSRSFRKVPLSTIRLAWHGQQQFAARHKVVFGKDDARYWKNPSNAWIDPMMTLVATYESIRRGRLAKPGGIQSMLPALREMLPDVPDVEIISSLAKRDGKGSKGPRIRSKTPPMIPDGFMVWQEEGVELPMPAEKLRYRGGWTSWQGAMEVTAAMEATAAIARLSKISKSENALSSSKTRGAGA